MKKILSVVALGATMALASQVALSAEAGERQDRMNDAYLKYRSTQPGGVDRSGTSVRRDARMAGHAVGNAARKTGHVIATGARKAGHAVGTGLRKTGSALNQGGEKLQDVATPKP